MPVESMTDGSGTSLREYEFVGEWELDDPSPYGGPRTVSIEVRGRDVPIVMLYSLEKIEQMLKDPTGYGCHPQDISVLEDMGKKLKQVAHKAAYDRAYRERQRAVVPLMA